MNAEYWYKTPEWSNDNLDEKGVKNFTHEDLWRFADAYFEARTKAENLPISGVSVSVLSDEEMREPIENALYSTNRFLTTQATDLAEGIIQYIKDAGYTITRTER